MLSKHPKYSKMRTQQTGVGLIEVLIAVLLVAFGLLGAAGMQARSISYTLDTERRQMASTVAVDLLEMMRSDASNVLKADGTPKDNLGGYQKAKGAALPAVTVNNTANECKSTVVAVDKRMGCWGARAKRLMPELTDDLITSQYSVSASANGVVSVVVAWPVKKGQCLSSDATSADNEYCTFKLQSRL